MTRVPARVKRVLRPVVSAVRQAGVRRVEPYLFVEAHAERLFWKYLAGDPDSVRQIVIVGSWQGAEIGPLLSRYRNAAIVAFEPSDDTFAILSDLLGANQRVRLYKEAVSDRQGQATFYEASLPGTGSLLVLDDHEDARTHNQGLAPTNSFSVPVVTLDSHPATSSLKTVDLLKIDVQGAELQVLTGGRQLLSRTSAVLIEVSVAGSAYRGAAKFPEVDGDLRRAGLTLCALGLDPVTLDGNALYVRLQDRIRRPRTPAA